MNSSNISGYRHLYEKSIYADNYVDKNILNNLIINGIFLLISKIAVETPKYNKIVIYVIDVIIQISIVLMFSVYYKLYIVFSYLTSNSHQI